jgi:recombination protein RecT
VVPAGVDPGRIMRLGLGAVLHDPNLLKCTPASLLLSLLKLTALGLEPNTPLQHAYIVGYSTKKKIKKPNGATVEEWIDQAQPIVGYRGQILLAVQTGAVVDVDGDVVHEKDATRVVRGTEPRLEHEPFIGNDGPGPMVGVYCTWELVNGRKKFRYWDAARIARYVEQYGYNKGSGGQRYMKTTYREHPEAMALKGVLHDASRFWPISGERAGAFSKAVEINDREGKGLPADFSEERARIAARAPGLIPVLEEGGDDFDLEPPAAPDEEITPDESAANADPDNDGR